MDIVSASRLTIRARGMTKAASEAGHMSAPGEARKAALKLPLAQRAVTHVAQIPFGGSVRKDPLPGPLSLDQALFPPDRAWASPFLSVVDNCPFPLHFSQSVCPGTCDPTLAENSPAYVYSPERVFLSPCARRPGSGPQRAARKWTRDTPPWQNPASGMAVDCHAIGAARQKIMHFRRQF